MLSNASPFPYQERSLVTTLRAVGNAILLKMSSTFAAVAEERAGLERRFNEIVRLHDALIVRICFGYARSRAELDDLHQDALVNVWQGLSRFKGDSSLRTWLYRVTLNTCVSTLRNRHKAHSALSELYDVIDEDAERREQIAELHESISRLMPVDKAVVLLWLEGFEYEEIASMTGLQRNTVATRLRRAKEKLSKL